MHSQPACSLRFLAGRGEFLSTLLKADFYVFHVITIADNNSRTEIEVLNAGVRSAARDMSIHSLFDCYVVTAMKPY